MPGQSADDYQLPPGMAVNAAVARAWDAMLGRPPRMAQTALEQTPRRRPRHQTHPGQMAAAAALRTRLRPPRNVARAASTCRPASARPNPRTSPSRTARLAPTPPTRPPWVPLHLLGAGVALDTKTRGVTARAPQSMVQDYLNRDRRAPVGDRVQRHTSCGCCATPPA